MTARSEHKRTKEYKAREERLPERIRKLSELAFKTFLENPSHPSLRHHPLEDNDRGRHRAKSHPVSINMQYRAIYTRDGGEYVWYWVGTHNDYDNSTGVK